MGNGPNWWTWTRNYAAFKCVIWTSPQGEKHRRIRKARFTRVEERRSGCYKSLIVSPAQHKREFQEFRLFVTQFTGFCSAALWFWVVNNNVGIMVVVGQSDTPLSSIAPFVVLQALLPLVLLMSSSLATEMLAFKCPHKLCKIFQL